MSKTKQSYAKALKAHRLVQDYYICIFQVSSKLQINGKEEENIYKYIQTGHCGVQLWKMIIKELSQRKRKYNEGTKTSQQTWKLIQFHNFIIAITLTDL